MSFMEESSGYDMDYSTTGAADDTATVVAVTLPTEAELALLCLDHLRAWRRTAPSTTPTTASSSSTTAKAMASSTSASSLDYLTVACWALNQAVRLDDSSHNTSGGVAAGDNDPFFDPVSDRENTHPKRSRPLAKKGKVVLPPLSEMEQELLPAEPPLAESSLPDHNHTANATPTAATWYSTSHGGTANNHNTTAYDDTHPSNAHRFYPVAGLGAHPLSLGQITTAGLAGLHAKSRLAAERDMIQSPLFESFVGAVHAKGFFRNDSDEEEDDNTHDEKKFAHGADTIHHHTDDRDNAVYEERFQKVVTKFRTKLCTKADLAAAHVFAHAAADAYTERRLRNLEERQQQQDADDGVPPPKLLLDALPVPSRFLPDRNHTGLVSVPNTTNNASSSPLPPSNHGHHAHDLKRSDSTLSNLQLIQSREVHPGDVEQAEIHKTAGNAAMQQKEYVTASEEYTLALKLSPTGPNSHVYYSNRAAALVSLKRFEDAIADSERSLALKPDYGKAHSRLGLAHFLLGHYRPAMEAYTVALKYEPDNQSSKNYLEKAAKRLAEAGDAGMDRTVPSSYSVVSEWDKARSSTPTVRSSTPPCRRAPTPPVTQQQQQSRSSTPTGITKTLSHGSRAPTPTHTASTTDDEAEWYKAKGNSLMAKREYHAALDAYTQAIRHNATGPLSHVYYSNRAAALCYLERYDQAERDSLTSVTLHPTYPKGHARLGLSRFFLQDYLGAVQAYTDSLRYDPDNAASQSYLVKAQAKLEAQQQQQR